jgi:hypothetical protein
MKCYDYICYQHFWSVSTKELAFSYFLAVTRFLYSRKRWRALGAKYLHIKEEMEEETKDVLSHIVSPVPVKEEDPLER